MKKIFVVLAALFLLAIIACSGGGGSESTGTSDSTLTTKQIEEIEVSSSSITHKLSTAADPKSEEALTDAKAYALTFPNVESADVINGNLVVKYRGAGQEIWIKNAQEYTVPEEPPEFSALASKSALGQIRVFKSPVGNRNAVLINTISEDPRLSYAVTVFDSMELMLERSGYNVDRLDGPKANLQNLANLSNYSVVVLLTHGGILSGGGYFMTTGEEWDNNWGNNKEIKVCQDNACYEEYRAHIDWGTSTEGKTMVGIAGDFWKAAYRSNNFTRALFLNGSCYGHNSDLFRQDLQSIGIVAYAGWTLETSKGAYGNWGIIYHMAKQGKTLQEAYDLLSDYEKQDIDLITNAPSSLWIGPVPTNNETSITLFDSASCPTGQVVQNGQCVTLSTGDYTSPNIGTLKYVPAGSFQRDGTATNISTVSAFRMSGYEITRAQFLAVMGVDPSYTPYSSGASDPVQMVTWYDAVEFCNKLSIAEGLTPVYTITGRTPATGYPITAATVTPTWANNGYRLPTEMEWMWAAMGATAGATGYLKAFAGSTGSNAIGDYAWTWENSSVNYKSQPVGTKLGNELGLHDMSGNVWEWCWDWYDAYPTGTQTNFKGAASGTYRVIRGGGWGSSASGATVAARTDGGPGNRGSGHGFRVVRP